MSSKSCIYSELCVFGYLWDIISVAYCLNMVVGLKNTYSTDLAHCSNRLKVETHRKRDKLLNGTSFGWMAIGGTMYVKSLSETRTQKCTFRLCCDLLPVQIFTQLVGHEPKISPTVDVHSISNWHHPPTLGDDWYSWYDTACHTKYMLSVVGLRSVNASMKHSDIHTE